ncbi:dynamin-binding protein [Plakobranchus ocellatus]|uniref:Dynamin-binding protein n=1 Tax=Plakobranchus ocellatus TaxID=259542 RepID=A0AAV4BHW3_9GAST|nr:dynamin-binding protein [Plakobranchus ocellatus]
MTLGVGDYAQARYAFQGESPGDLSLQEGDVVKITGSVDTNWLTGEKVGHEAPPLSGNFPQAFVEQLSLPSVRTGQKVFLALQDFMAEQTGDLELAKGDIITGIEAVDECWWRGKNGPLKGIFPLSFVAELWHDDGLRSRSYSARAGSLKSRSGSFAGSRTSSIGGSFEFPGPVTGGGSFDASITRVTEPTFARALVDVSPQLDGELAFQLGDLIEITEIIDEDWFFGRCHNKEGLVSAVCVELLENDDTGVGAEDTCGRTSEHEGSSQKNFPHVPHPALKELQIHEGSEEYRQRNASSGSYTSENTRSHDAEIVPYAQVLYPFTAQGRSELSLEEGQIVTLIRHVDADWTEGELDGRQGLFPTSFVDILVDCARDESVPSDTLPADGYSDQYETRSEAAVGDGTTFSSSFEHNQSLDGQKLPVKNVSAEIDSLLDCKQAEQRNESELRETGITAEISDIIELSEGSEIGLVLHTFHAQMDGDVSVTEGDTVEVVRQVDENWLEVRTDASAMGLVPRNHIEVIGVWPKEESNTKGTGPTGDLCGITAPQSHREPDRNVNPPLGPSSHLITEAENFYNNQSGLPAAKTQEGHQLLIKSSKALKPDIKAIPTQALPCKKPSLPPKPALAPKPALKPKPPIMSKPPMEKSHSLTLPKPVRPPPLMTARPFSSLPRRKPQHVMSPTERRLSMSSLDSIIEGEMEKAKSRSSSQTSDGSNERSYLVEASSDTSATAESSATLPVTQSNATPSSTSTGTSSVAEVQGQSSDYLISGEVSVGTNSAESTSTSRNEHLGFEDNFSDTVAENKQAQTVKNTCSSATTGGKPALLTSLSVSEHKSHTLDNNEQRRKSASYAETANGRPAVPSANSPAGGQSSFVNKAFEMEVDEGKLLDLGGDRHPLPKRVAPLRPPSAINNSTAALPSLLTSKAKAPPPRPSGPRIASAPSNVPLKPARTTPLPPKLVPKRPAPKAPGPGPASKLQSTNLNNNKSSPAQPAVPASRPVPQSPVRQPPRPSSLATPPPRAPPPRPTDLIVFSPDEPNDTPSEDISDETKREMVRDLKNKLEENKADIKHRNLRRA